MENVTLIKFEKNNGLAKVRKLNGEASLNDRTNIFSQLVGFAHDKKLKFDMSRIPEGVDDSVGFIMKNDSARIIIEFEEKKDACYSQLESIYIKQKIEKDNKVKKFKKFVSGTVIAATLVGATFIGVDGYFKELDAKNEITREYYENIIQKDPDNISANAYFEFVSNDTNVRSR